MSGSNSRSSNERRELGAPGDHHELRVAVERPGVEVDRAEADDVVGDHDLRVHDGARQLPHLDARRVRSAYRCLSAAVAWALFEFSETTTRTFTPRRAAAMTRSIMSGSVRYGFITSSRSRAAVDLLPDRLRGRDEAAGDHLRERDRRRAGVGRLGEQAARGRPAAARRGRWKLVRNAACACRTTSPVTRTITSWKPPFSKWSSMPAPPVHATVPSTTYSLRWSARPSASWRHAALRGGEEPVPLAREDVVDDDLRAGRGEPREHLSRRRVRPGAEPVDDHPHLDALRQLPLQQMRPSASPPRPPASRT